jgi:hypothetical protein
MGKTQQIIPRPGPVSVKWNEDDLDALYPKIAAKINGEGTTF